MKLLLDPGGTRLKFAAINEGEIQDVSEIAWYRISASGEENWAPESPWTDWNFESCHWLLRPDPPAAPNNWLDSVCAAFNVDRLNCSPLDPTSMAPFQVGYRNGKPGSDRMAAAVACYNKRPEGSFVIIDAGTCITVDLLTNGTWKGGAILPGLRLQAASMRQAGLPEIQPNEANQWSTTRGAEGALGTDTEAAIRAGIPWATFHAVQAVAKALMEFAEGVEVVLTGGDAEHFAGLGGWRTFADPNLVLRGGALLLKESKT